MSQNTITISVNQLHELIIGEGASFRGNRRIRTEAEEYMIEEAMKFRGNSAIHLDIRVSGSIEDMEECISGIRSHFLYRKARAENSLKRVLQNGWRSLFIAIIFLALVVSFTLGMESISGNGGFMITIREVLIIVGWVALWRPADILLYEWRPYKKEAKLFGRLASASIQISQSRVSLDGDEKIRR